MPASFFPILRSVLQTEALVEQVLAPYELPGPVTCHLLQRGHNDTHLVTFSGGKAILRVYTVGWRSAEEIAAEIDLLALLAANGLSVPMAIPCADGAMIRAVEAPEGTRHAALFAFVEGKPPRPFMPEHGYRYGQVVAEFHTIADRHVPPLPRFHYDLARLVDVPLERLRAFAPVANRADVLPYLHDVAARLKAEAEALPRTAPTYGLCHGDLHTGNVFFTGQNEVALIDFDLFGYGWRAYDVATACWGFLDADGYGEGSPDARHAFLDGYQSVRPLSEAERRALPYFVLLRQFWLWGTGIGRSREFGIGWLLDGYFDRSLKFLSDWLAAPW